MAQDRSPVRSGTSQHTAAGGDVVRVYRVTEPAIYRRGEIAEAEPAVPGWKMPVDELFS